MLKGVKENKKHKTEKLSQINREKLKFLLTSIKPFYLYEKNTEKN